MLSVVHTTSQPARKANVRALPRCQGCYATLETCDALWRSPYSDRLLCDECHGDEAADVDFLP